MTKNDDNVRLIEAYELLRLGKIDESLNILKSDEVSELEWARYYVGHIYSGNYDRYFDFNIAEQQLIIADQNKIEIAKKELGYLYYRVGDFVKSASCLQKSTHEGDVEASYWYHLALIKSNADRNEIYNSLKKSFELNNPYAVRKYSIQKIQSGNFFQKISFLYHYFRSAYLFIKFESKQKNLRA